MPEKPYLFTRERRKQIRLNSNSHILRRLSLALYYKSVSIARLTCEVFLLAESRPAVLRVSRLESNVVDHFHTQVLQLKRSHKQNISASPIRHCQANSNPRLTQKTGKEMIV